jgi:radical SAM superfamily enzyme YgiQ (UPF0313 family)
MRKADILLLNPPSNTYTIYTGEHLGLGYLAAILRQKGYNVTLIDSDIEHLSISQTIDAVQRASAPQLVGISLTDPSGFQNVVPILGELRKQNPKVHITGGGYLSTFWREEILLDNDLFDSIVVGEGELTLLELIEALNNDADWKTVPGLCYCSSKKIFHSPKRMLIKNLDSLPFPVRDYLKQAYKQHYVANFSASRGCYYHCNFCQITEFYRLHENSLIRRERSAENITEEMSVLIRNYGVRHILFVDDDFIGVGMKGLERAHAIADEIIRRKLDCTFGLGTRVDNMDKEVLRHLKEAGLISVFPGIESGIGQVLDNYNKHTDVISVANAIQVISELDLILRPLFILIDGFTSLKELQQSVEFFKTHRLAIPWSLNELDILKGTQIEKIYVEEGLLIESEEPFTIHYKHKFEEGQVFSNHLAPQYRQIYTPLVSELHRLLYLFGNLRQNDRKSFRTDLDSIISKTADQHLKFLTMAIQALKSNQSKFDENALIPLQNTSQEIYSIARHTADQWELILPR